jgi:Tol biopolymer transport system component
MTTRRGGPLAGRQRTGRILLDAGVVATIISLTACSVEPRNERRSARESSSTHTLLLNSIDCPRPITGLSFVSTRNGHEEIYRMDIRRPRNVTRLTRLPGFAMDHTWSPDGKRFAFRWFRGGEVGVHLAKADGSDVQSLVRQAAMPAWSPDGTKIAVANLHRGDRGISVMRVERALRGGRSRLRVVTRTDDAVPEEQPAWSPDGKQIAFTSHRTGTSDIWIVDADGDGLRNLTPDPSLDEGASWSPDGTSLVFGSNRDASSPLGGDLYIMNADGTGLRRLTNGESYAPAWSPDGRWIAFNSTRRGNSDVSLIRPDGTEVRRLTAHPEADGIASWVGQCRGRR